MLPEFSAPLIEQQYVPIGHQQLCVVTLTAPSALDRPTVGLFVHGWASSKIERDYFFVRIARRLSASGLGTCVLFDCRGHGESDAALADASCDSIQADIRHMLDWAEQRYPRREIVLIGASLGATLSLLALPDRPNTRCIMIAPALNLPPVLSSLPQLGEFSSGAAALLWAEQEGSAVELCDGFAQLGGLWSDVAAERLDMSFFVEGVASAHQVAHDLLRRTRREILLHYYDRMRTFLRTIELSPSVALSHVTSDVSHFQLPSLETEVANSSVRWLAATRDDSRGPLQSLPEEEDAPIR